MAITITKDLPVALDDITRAKLRAQATDHAIAYADLEARRAELGKLAKREREQLDAIAKELRSGRQVLPVECTEVQDFGTNTVQVQRVDTGEVVETRAMSSTERQEQMFEDPGGKAKVKLTGKAAAALADEPEEADASQPH